MAAMVDGVMPAPGGGAINQLKGGSSPSSGLKQVDRVRSVFPETWLWSNSTVGLVMKIATSFLQGLLNSKSSHLRMIIFIHKFK